MFQSRTISAALAIAMTGFAAPAAAQQALCGGAGEAGQWIGGNEASSDISSSTSHQEQMALVLGGNQYVSLFTLSQPTGVRIEAQARGSGDPLMDILDANGNIVGSDDDSGGGGASRAELDLPAGTYCAQVSSYDGTPMTAFVRVGTVDQEPLTPGIDTSGATGGSGEASGSCAEATDLGVLDGPLQGEGAVEDGGYWRFTLASDSAVSITAQNEDADPVLTLYDGDENYINENDDFDGLNSRLDMAEPLAAGTYCIGLDALNDASLPIAVEVSVYDPVAALMALYDRGEAAPPLDGSHPVTDLGALDSRMRKDTQVSDTAQWFSVDVSAGGLLVIEAVSADGQGDPWLALYDDFGRQIAINDDYGDGYDSFLAARVGAGTYMVAVKQVTADYSGFVRLAFERFLPAK